MSARMSLNSRENGRSQSAPTVAFRQFIHSQLSRIERSARVKQKFFRDMLA